MVLLTGLALFAFVVLPVVDSYMRKNTGSGGDSVVASFDGKDLTQNRVDYFTRNHNETVEFLSKLANATIERGGVPRTPGFQYDPRSKRVLRLGINQSPGSEVSVRTMMFAAEARKEGFDLDDNAIRVWLDRFTDGTVSDSDITGMLMNSTQNRMGRPHLYEQLRSHLLADVYLKRGYAGLYTGDNPSMGALMTPSEQWESFVKLNRSATVDAYGVLVNDFIDQTNETPPEAMILTAYEDGKNRDPNDQSPEPAFHQRYTASFEYLVGDLTTFIDEEVAKLKDEDIRAEYDKRVAGGGFQLPDEELQNVLDAEDGEDSEPADGKSEDTEAEEMDSDDEAEESPEPADKPESVEEPEAADDPESTDEPEATDEPESPDEPESTDDPESTDEPESAEEAESMPEDPVTEAPTESEKADDSDSEAPPVPEGESPSEGEPSEGDQSSLSANRPVRLVALQEESEEGDSEEGKDPEEAAEKSEESSESEAEKKEPAKTEPAETKSDDAEPAETDESEAEADEPEMDAEKADAEKADAEKAGEDAESEADAEKEDEPKEEKEPKVQTFEDVREQIANDMAFPTARQRMVESAAKAFKRMQTYFNQKSIYDSNVLADSSGEEPEKLDLEALAKEFGFEFKAIGPYSRVSIADEPIATSMDAQTQFGNQGPNFALMMYGYSLGQNIVERKPLYTPLQTTEFMSGKTFVSWKVGETEASTPTLAEAREDVINHLRRKEAKDLAQTAAEDFAKKAAEQADTPLAELIPEDKKENLKEGLGPFKWLDSQGRGVTMGNVPELDAVGDDFMAAVFEGDTGEYRIASNQPERVIYVVKSTKFEPSVDELQQRFREPANRRNISAIDAGIGGVLREFYESIDKKAGFVDHVSVSEQ